MQKGSLGPPCLNLAEREGLLGTSCLALRVVACGDVLASLRAASRTVIFDSSGSNPWTAGARHAKGAARAPLLESGGEGGITRHFVPRPPGRRLRRRSGIAARCQSNRHFRFLGFEPRNRRGQTCERGRSGPFANVWRRGRDSNPRYSREYNGFRDRPVRPLRHLSVFCTGRGRAATAERILADSVAGAVAAPVAGHGISRVISQSFPTRWYWKRSCSRLGRPCQNSNSSGCRR